MVGRRRFLHTSIAGAGALLATKVSKPFAWAQSSSSDSRIEILPNEPIGDDLP